MRGSLSTAALATTLALAFPATSGAASHPDGRWFKLDTCLSHKLKVAPSGPNLTYYGLLTKRGQAIGGMTYDGTAAAARRQAKRKHAFAFGPVDYFFAPDISDSAVSTISHCLRQIF